MKKLLVILGLLLATSSIALANETPTNLIDPVISEIRYYDTDLCRWWSSARFPDGRFGFICQQTGRAQVADAFSVHQELEALKKRVEELEKKHEDK